MKPPFAALTMRVAWVFYELTDTSGKRTYSEDGSGSAHTIEVREVSLMTPEERKVASETLLREHGVAINPGLPPIESDDEVVLRSRDEVLQRLVALWAVVGSAFLEGNAHFRAYIVQGQLESWLSKRELAFLLGDDRTRTEIIQFTWKLECLYFLAWAAGLIKTIELPKTESSVGSIMDIFPQEMEEPARLRDAIAIRAKTEIMAWADLLYRLHWAAREGNLKGTECLGGLNGGMVQEWHLAVNWLTQYENEDDWDLVGTDT